MHSQQAHNDCACTHGNVHDGDVVGPSLDVQVAEAAVSYTDAHLERDERLIL